MKKKNRDSLASKYWLLILSAVCLALMGLSLISDGINGPLRTLADWTVIPMQKGINHIGTMLSDVTENFETLQITRQEKETLQAKVDELTVENKMLQQEKYELERLQELYKLDSDYADYEKVGAHVIGKDPGNWFSTFTIDKGSDDGLAVNMNVMAGSGLVGIITEVAPGWSRVRSIIDDSSNISAMTLSTLDTCIVKGDLKLMGDGKIKFEQLENNKNNIAVGEELVTSHISDRYLQGITIGIISDIKVDANDLTRSGYLTPVVDFKHLQEVLVITTLKQDMQSPSGDNAEKEGRQE